jgi:hypothetical protein
VLRESTNRKRRPVAPPEWDLPYRAVEFSSGSSLGEGPGTWLTRDPCWAYDLLNNDPQRGTRFGFPSPRPDLERIPLYHSSFALMNRHEQSVSIRDRRPLCASGLGVKTILGAKTKMARRRKDPSGYFFTTITLSHPRCFSQRGRIVPIAMANRNQIFRMTCHIRFAVFKTRYLRDRLPVVRWKLHAPNILRYY